ncbi:DUF3841 domain-containing protein [Miniphocaeibacter massiliensis]|uniref:DUF3841 domain-containing protein n=1 Tax=Miniphocaeibacter massiliensis TaxID=2041841 RepID=UPI000C08B39C|nr:DUF3841 domain-containing protein [Miniphocaeibacter massiliensis]
MIIYTCQNIKSLEILNSNKRFINKKFYIEEHFEDISNIFLRCYDWFVIEASKKVKKPTDVEYPIWCSITPRNCMIPIENEIIYILDVPDDEIILFDGSKWDFVLNLRYIPLDDKDFDNYIFNLKRKGIKNEYTVFNSTDNLIEQQKIIDSWYRIFEIENSKDIYIQANIWEIKKEWIIDIVRYREDIPEKYFKRIKNR